MKMSTLAPHYDALTPWERFPLIVAAAHRGDDAEWTRLVGSAPTSLFRIPNHFGLGLGINALLTVHMTDQLAQAASYWSTASLLNRGDSNFDERLRSYKLLRLQAYMFVLDAGAWKSFCSELHLDPEELLRALPGYDIVRRTQQVACSLEVTREQALGYLVELTNGDADTAGDNPAGVGDKGLPTMEALVGFMKEHLQAEFKKWS
jgi:hypothetical protein